MFNFEFEKYWMFPSNYSKERKQIAIKDCIESNEYIGSLKKDGNMSRFIKSQNIIKLQSRTFSKVTNEYSDKKDYVPHIIKTLDSLPNDTIIIGELYYPHGNSDLVGSILRCKANKAIERQETKDYGYLHYYIHDIWFFNNENFMNLGYDMRIKQLMYVYETYLKTNPYIEIAKYAATPDGIKKMIQFAFANDEEGVVLVRKDALVEPGKRTAWKTLKIKKELQEDIDCFTTGKYKEATRLYNGKEIESWEYWENLKTGKLLHGNYYKDYSAGRDLVPITKSFFYGWASSIEIGWYNENDEIEVIGYVSGISDEVKKDIKENNKDYILRPCHVTAMEWTKDGSLRHPKFIGFRDDIDPKDCRKDKIFTKI